MIEWIPGNLKRILIVYLWKELQFISYELQTPPPIVKIKSYGWYEVDRNLSLRDNSAIMPHDHLSEMVWSQSTS